MDPSLLSLSLVQGISEILPVSSSVNLYLFSRFLNIHDFSFSLKISLHAGSLLTLLWYFRHEISDIFKGLFGAKKISDTFFFSLFFGTLPVVIFGYFARDFVKEFASQRIMGMACIVFGLLLVWFDKLGTIKSNNKGPVSVVSAFIIGCFQTIAIFPGVSRLGICITSSRMLNLDRKKAIKFSLMLAIPSISGSLVLELYECFKTQNFSIFSANSLVGALVTSLVGLVAIYPCIRYMERCGFVALAIYRLVIGTMIFFL